MPRGVKDRAGGTWTSAKYFGFIRSALRRAWMKFPTRYQALNDAKRPYGGKDKRTKWEYQCNHCSKWFKTKEVQVDHIVPAGTLKSYEHLPAFVEKLFCEKANLQILCKPCHEIKTKEERNG